MLTFLFKNLLIFTQNFSLSNVEKKFFLSSLFLKKIYQIFKIWKKFMHKNAIKIVGGVKFSKKIPQNVGFFDQKVWDFWHWGGDKIVGFSASRGGFSPFNFWPHCITKTNEKVPNSNFESILKKSWIILYKSYF